MRKPFKWVRWAAVTGMVVLVASGCSWPGSKSGKPSIDPPPTGADTAAGVQAVPASTSPFSMMQVTIYAKDDKGFVAPVTIDLPKTESVAKKALEYMVDGGPGGKSLPAGFTELIPQGTEIKAINIMKDKKLAIVDFSKRFTDYNLQDERKILEAITWTMTGFPSVEKVQLWVEGKALKEMPVNGTPLDEPLGRTMGINIEKPESVEYGQSTPVTLYFLSQGKNNYQYYVPVTRLVKRTDNIAQAVVDQLIAGPDAKKGLAAVFASGAEVLQLKQADDLITVNFSDKLLGPDKKAPAEGLKAVVLSLTENAGLQTKVQVMVNGDMKVSTTDNQSYAKPVSRPSNLNQIKM
ncbi:GerMN domain-containing protein [Paenibacillus thalictri]|uniref:Stage II sporulation protein n=1 Tax=Paenibacillus thalictri TaxID=2527873 RepID=A0A4Q9E0D5_9BACL|nr:GerMN domain-containing protein [Paenibacillus thalictri]TBL81688.1 stage II sporulation protein [Paenibacillus thalictri]